MTSTSSRLRADARPDVVRQAAHLSILFAVVFGSGVGAILLAKQSLVVAGVWLGNGAAIVSLLRLPATQERDRFFASAAVVLFATLAANLAAGNTIPDSLVFTLGNGAEIFVGYLIIKSHPFARATVAVSDNPVSLLILPLLMAALLAPAVGATIGAALLSSGGSAGPLTVWMQWWLPSALGLLLVVPPGLFVSRRSLAEMAAKMPIVRDLLLLAAMGILIIAAVILTRHMTAIMLASPVVLLAAIRYHGIGVSAAILACVFPMIPMAASEFGSNISTMPTAGERLALLQAFAVLTGLVGLWVASVLDEKAALIRALGQSTATARDLSLARQRLLMTVAHDIRTPLSVIEGCSEMLTADRSDPERNERLVHAIRDSSATLKTLANDLLETARRESASLTVDPRWIDPKPILGSVIDELTVLGTDNSDAVTLSCRGEVWADPHRLRQIAMNLISNALKHGRGFGPISVQVSSVEGASLLVVSDRGPGIEAADLLRIFEPFGVSGGPVSSRSAGVGLALVKQLAEAHGGWARCISTPFVETRLEVSLPHPGHNKRPVTTSDSIASIDPDTLF